jgi:hypothetical protein
MSRDYEYLTRSSETMADLTMIRLMLTRLANRNEKQFLKKKEQQAA